MMSGCGILTNGKGTRREYCEFSLDELQVSAEHSGLGQSREAGAPGSIRWNQEQVPYCMRLLRRQGCLTGSEMCLLVVPFPFGAGNGT